MGTSGHLDHVKTFSTACLSRCWLAKDERIKSIIDFTTPAGPLHNKNIHFAVMNCWLVLGLRWRDLSIIVLCEDIAAIDSSDTNLSPGIPWYHLNYITGTLTTWQLDNSGLRDCLTCSSPRPLPTPDRSRTEPRRRWWRWPPRNSGSTSFSLISGLQHQTSWNKINISTQNCGVRGVRSTINKIPQQVYT